MADVNILHSFVLSWVKKKNKNDVEDNEVAKKAIKKTD